MQNLAALHSFNHSLPVQGKADKTGLPHNLRTGIENLSGISMGDVKVHYNSSKPAQLNAYAYARGTDIHLAAGQEKHLPHEAWHVVQQKQGRVNPSIQLRSGVKVNDDPRLESEATRMGAQALKHAASTLSGSASATPETRSMQLKLITQYTSAVVQRVMNKEELDKLQRFLQQYTGQIGEDEINELWNYFGQGYDTLEAAMPELTHRIQFVIQQSTQHNFRVNATTYPRVFLAGDDKPGRDDLKGKFGKPATAKGFDLSYRDHTDAIDKELDAFLPSGDLDVEAQREAYYKAARESQATTTERNKPGMFSVSAPGGLSMSSITPDMMGHYGNMHYKSSLVKPDETSTTRAYEHEFTGHSARELNIEAFRSFFLPPGSDAPADQELMINTLGAGLDSNTPTRGNTLGAGKVNSMVYLHFRRTLELLNADLDKGPLAGSLESFENRTRLHIQYLRNYTFKGMMENEEEHSKTTKGALPWDSLKPMILQSALLINAMLNVLSRNEKLPDFRIDLRDAHVIERLRTLSMVLGLMVKVEKRIAIDRALINEGSQEALITSLTLIANLGEVEQNINAALARYAPELNALKSGKQDESGMENKSGLDFGSKGSVEDADREFDQLVLTNNCLPEAILGRKLTLIEARELRLNLLGNGQRIGGFLDADQPVIATIAQQFNFNMNIIIFERGQVWRRFLVNGGNVLDITLSHIPIPPHTAIILERINRNHFIRRG